MAQRQVDGCNAVLDQLEARHGAPGDRRWLVYMLATTKWETGHTMQPVEEWGHGAGRPYASAIPGPARSMTAAAKCSSHLGRELPQDGRGARPRPGQPARVRAAARRRRHPFHGHAACSPASGWRDTVDDPVNARRIINGTDHAEDIAAIHADFLAGLS